MQMLNKNEFITELLNKYEITHGLSKDIVNGMIDRGFIPSITNEFGDQTYNIDYYIENEDVLESRLKEYKNTRGYYTDTELKEALSSRDSTFTAIPVNALNNLARRNLIAKDDYYVVRQHEKFLFAPNLIYDLEAVKAALSELDAQLEAEEAEEMTLLFEEEQEETEADESEEIKASENEDEDIFDDDDFYDDFEDEQTRKKERDRAIAKDRLKKEEAKRAAESAAIEAAAAAAATAKSLEHYTETKSTETPSVDSSANNYNSTKEDYTPEKSEYNARPQTIKDDNSSHSDFKQNKSEGVSASTQEHYQKERLKQEEAKKQYEEDRRKALDEIPEENKPKLRNEDGTMTFTGTSVGKDNYPSETPPYNDYDQHLDTHTQHYESDYSSNNNTPKHEESKGSEYSQKKNLEGLYDTPSYTTQSSADSYSYEKPKDNAPDAAYASSYDNKEQSPETIQNKSEENHDTSYGVTHQNTSDYKSNYEEYYQETSLSQDSNVYNDLKPEPGYQDVSPIYETPSEVKHTQEKSTDYSDTSSFSDTYNSSEEVKRKEEALEQKLSQEQYESSRRQSIENNTTETKPELRDADGNITFTGTSVGKEEYVSPNKSAPESYSDFSQNSVSRPENKTSYSSSEDNFESGYVNRSIDSTPESQSQNDGFVSSFNSPSDIEGQSSAASDVAKSDYKDINVKKEDSSSENLTNSAQSYEYSDYKTEEHFQQEKIWEEQKSREDYEKKHRETFETQAEESRPNVYDSSGNRTFTGSSIGEKDVTPTETQLTREESTYRAGNTPSYVEKKDAQTSASIESASQPDSSSAQTSVYSVNIPLADGSYMTFEAQTPYKETNKGFYTTDPYDNYNIRAQAAYVASGVVLSQSGIDEVIADVSKHSEDGKFKVTVSTADDEGKFTSKTIYSSDNVETFVSDITETYRKSSLVETLPADSPDQIRINQNILSVIGVQSGGEIKNDTYVPAAVPAIHPRIFDELKEQGVKFVEVNGEKHEISVLADISKENFSVVRNAPEYQNAIIAQKEIEALADHGFKISSPEDAEKIKKAEEVIAAASRTQNDFQHQFSIDKIQSNPNYVSAYLREKYIDEKPAKEEKSFETTNFADGIESRRPLGTAKDLGGSSNSSFNSERSIIPNFSTIVKPATESTEAKQVKLDFSKPEEIEAYATQIEKADPQLASELRNLSNQINNTDVFASQPTDTVSSNNEINPSRVSKPDNLPEIIKEAQDISVNDTEALAAQAQALLKDSHVMKGHAQEIEDIAAKLDFEHYDIAKQLREASKSHNGELAQIYEQATIAERGLNRVLPTVITPTFTQFGANLPSSSMNSKDNFDGSSGQDTTPNSGTTVRTATRTATKVLGTATETIDIKEVKLDFSKPEEIEAYAAQIEKAAPKLAEELRTVSLMLNGDVAIVMMHQTLGTTPKVDGLRLVNSPETYIEGKAKYAEMVATAIQAQNPEMAQKIRTLSKELNGDAADIFAGINTTTGEALLQNPEKYIKGKAADAEAVADAISERYPETAKKIRELSAQLNRLPEPIAKANNIEKDDVAALAVQAQELLKNTRVFKGHAQEIEAIAAKLDFEYSSIAKQLREASIAQNKDVARIYAKATIAERGLNRVLPTVINPIFTPVSPSANKNSSGGDNRVNGGGGNSFGIKTAPITTTITAKFVMGGQPSIEKNNRRLIGRLTADKIKTTQKMLTFTEKDKLGKKHLNVVTFNSDGTMNITWNADKKTGSVTLMGYAPDVQNFDKAEIQGALGSKYKLLRAGIRNRKLDDFRFVSTKNAQFALDPVWVKSRRKAQTHQEKPANVDELANQMLASAQKVYQAYAAGMTNVEMEALYDKDGFAGDGTIIKGMRAKELRQEALKDNLTSTGKRIFRRIMPTAELNGTYIGTGFKFLAGRGSLLWAVSQHGNTILAKEIRSELAADVLQTIGPATFKMTDGAKILNFASAKDRRKISKELSQLSMAALKTDVTRLSVKALQKALKSGEYGGKNLSAKELEMFSAALQLKRINTGTLNGVSAFEYMKAAGIYTLNPALSSKYAKILNNKKIEDLSYSEITTILANNPTIDKELAEALQMAQSAQVVKIENGKIKSERHANMDDAEALDTVLKALNAKSLDARFASLLGGKAIADLSNSQIEKLLKNLANDNSQAATNLKDLLNKTLDIRGKKDKLKDAKEKSGGNKRIAQYFIQKGIVNFRNTYFGAAIYSVWNAYRTVKSVQDVIRTVKIVNNLMQDALLDWLKKGNTGGLRSNFLNSKFADKLRGRRNRKQVKQTQKAQDSLNKAAAKKVKKDRKKENRLAKKNERKAKRAEKRFGKKGINKSNGRLRKKITSRAGKPGRLRGLSQRLGKGANKLLAKVASPFKAVSAFSAKIKAEIISALAPALAEIGLVLLIIIGIFIGIQFSLGMLNIGLEAVYSVINPVPNDTDEKSGLSIEDSLVDNSIELCINLDSALKYYNEKLFEEDTVIKAVKDAIKDAGYKDELDSFYDPAANGGLGGTANFERLGTTLRGIQTGVYYSYYNGDGQEIGYKSNAKDIASMANAWIGDDYRTKGLYKSYVEKLWNYTHVVAYAPRTQGENTTEEITDGHRYNGNQYVYTCPSNDKDSECYAHEYTYKCNDTGANVYKNKTVRDDIKNGVDKESNKKANTYSADKFYCSNCKTYVTPNGSMPGTLNSRKCPVCGKIAIQEYRAITLTNGIAEYNEFGCTQHQPIYHSGANDGVYDATPYVCTTPLQIKLTNKQNTRIRFYYRSDNAAIPAPSGCSNWKSISFAKKTSSGEVKTYTAYYCAGCCPNCTGSETKTTNKDVNNNKIMVDTKKAAYHTGTKPTTINGKIFYNSLSSSCTCDKENYWHTNTTKTFNGVQYNHYLGTTPGSCTHAQSFIVTTTKTVKTYCNTGYCEKGSVSKSCAVSYNTSQPKLYMRKSDGSFVEANKHTFSIPGGSRQGYYYMNTSGTVNENLYIRLNVSAPSGYTLVGNAKYAYVQLSKIGYRNFECSSGTSGSSYYIWDVTVKPGITFNNINQTCYPSTCKGHSTTTTVKTTHYNCAGHIRCRGYLVNNPQNLTLNYCGGTCSGHTVAHYCTGHVDLNVANVTLFLEDKNSMLYLGVPKEVESSKQDVYAREEFNWKGEAERNLEVQTPKEGTTYLYNNAFDVAKFKKFDYEKFPLPNMSVWAEFAIDLKGKSVSDPKNFGNPLDTVRWNQDFIKKDVDTIKVDGVKTKSLNSVISRLFSSFSEEGIWEDRNDGGSGLTAGLKVNTANIKGSYTKFTKHHYFDGFFKYTVDTKALDEGETVIGKLKMTGDAGNQKPQDNGPAARAIEATREDWYIAYKIVFPGAYNAAPDSKEINRIIQNIQKVAKDTPYENKVTLCISGTPGIRNLLNSIGQSFSGATIDTTSYDKSGLGFACSWYNNFYKNQSSSNTTTLNNVINAYNQTSSFKSYSYRCRKFRQLLKVNSLSGTAESPKTQEEIETTIKNLSVGDLIGAGDEVYLVLYNDTNSRTYPNGTDTSKRGIEKGHVIVATVNGSGAENNDQVHLFSFTAEYLSKKSELFWVYKCTPGYVPN